MCVEDSGMSDLDHCKRRPLRYGLELEARLCVMCATGILHTGRLGDSRKLGLLYM